MKYLLAALLVCIAWRDTNAQKHHLTNKEGLPSNELWYMTRDRQGFSWIGTGRHIENGVSIYHPDENKLYHLAEFYNNGIHVKDMDDDKANGILWICTRERIYTYSYRNLGVGTSLLGLSHSDALLEWQRTTNPFRLKSYPISALTNQIRWIQHRPYAFTEKGLFVGDPQTGNFSTWPLKTKLFTTTDFRDGLLDCKGRLWIANLVDSLKMIDPATEKEFTLCAVEIEAFRFHHAFSYSFDIEDNEQLQDAMLLPEKKWAWALLIYMTARTNQSELVS